MRLLASTDIALRVLMLLAGRPSGGPLSVEKLSSLLGGLSRNHLHKIVQALAASGLVNTVRGVGGGVVLAVAPERIRIGKLVRDLERDQAVVECFRADGGACTLRAGCRLRGFIGNAREDFYRRLDTHTIADCIPQPRAAAIRKRRARVRVDPTQ
jgi:Rrf2 family transcriptional regulator, nitric oxide-sensitive transcriptional repressor